jgi:hypothetical protein
MKPAVVPGTVLVFFSAALGGLGLLKRLLEQPAACLANVAIQL